MAEPYRHVAVLGGGSYGTALATHLARQGQHTTLWVRDPAQAEAMRQTRRNPRYLSEFTLPPALEVSAELPAAVARAEWLVLATPCHAVRATLQRLAPLWAQRPLVMGAKGIDFDSLCTMDELAEQVLGRAARRRLVALSGPSFAREVVLGHPTAVVLACRDPSLCEAVAPLLFCENFRAYCQHDVVGVMMGGALKNVMAIAAGAIAGLGLGDNTRAALITRGVAEITRLAVAKGGEALTLLGLAGVGDLVLTCTGAQSRNRSLGEALGAGCSMEAALARVGQVVEGVRTAAAAHRLAARLGVDAPITRAVYRVLHEAVPVAEAMLELTRRAPGRELD